MVLPRGKLTIADVTEIKEMIWNGEKQRSIAEHFRVSQATISYILRGHQWGEVPWPNGETGHMPEDQWRRMKMPPKQHYVPSNNEAHNRLVHEVARRHKEKMLSGEIDSEEDTKEDLEYRQKTLEKILAKGKGS